MIRIHSDIYEVVSAATSLTEYTTKTDFEYRLRRLKDALNKIPVLYALEDREMESVEELQAEIDRLTRENARLTERNKQIVCLSCKQKHFAIRVIPDEITRAAKDVVAEKPRSYVQSAKELAAFVLTL